MSITIPNNMELCRTYGALECGGIVDDRVTPYPKLYHPFRVIPANTNKRYKNDNYWTKIGKIGNYRQFSIGDAFISNSSRFVADPLTTGK